MDADLTRTASSRLRRLLGPRSLAVLGGMEAGKVIEQCERLGFAGEIWPVNPKRGTLGGRKCCASLADLPGIPDVAFIAVPRAATIAAVADLSAMGCGGAVCYASGFAEVGVDGARHQAALVAAAGAMPVLGPNCYGFVNALERAALWPDNHGLEPLAEGAAIITQSGNMGINFTMSKRALPLACLMSLGNQAQVKVTDALEALLDDERIKVIGLHVEGIDDVARFSRLAIRALEKRVPLVAFKTGASEKGAHATVSHTSTLAGADALYDALFERYGIARVHSVTAFLETLKFLSLIGPVNGTAIASLSCSGGEASLMADRAASTGLAFRNLTADHAARVRATLHDYVNVTNPLDYHTFIWGDREAIHATFDAMVSGDFDATILVLDFPTRAGADDSDWYMTAEVFAAAAHANNAHGVVMATLPECMSDATARRLAAWGVAPMVGVDDTLAAIAAAARIGTAQRRKPPAPLQPAEPVAGKTVTLDEFRAKARLAAAGITVPNGMRTTPSKAAAAAKSLGFSVALKAVGDGIAHKSELGAVRLGLTSAAQVARAAADLKRHAPELLVERMVEDAVAELIVGIARDPQFGLYLVIGAGGIAVELMKDAAIVLLPTTKPVIRRALLDLKAAPLLKGFRGRPKADVSAAVDAAWAVARFAETHRDTIMELDINPLIVRERGKGAVAADALIRVSEGGSA